MVPKVCSGFYVWSALSQRTGHGGLGVDLGEDGPLLREQLGSPADLAVGQNCFGIPFWLVGEFTTHFSRDFSGNRFGTILVGR